MYQMYRQCYRASLPSAWATVLLFLGLSFSLSLTGCATVKNFEFDNLNPKNINWSKFKPKSAAAKHREIAAKFPKNQVPHTLLRKPVAAGVQTSGFGYRLNPAGVRLPKKHNGVDYAAEVGTPIFASGDGKIIKKYLSTSYGNFIQISHANGFSSAYAHLESFAPAMEIGARVAKGQVIGFMGSTGRSTASHLHYELRYKGERIDPMLGEEASK